MCLLHGACTFSHTLFGRNRNLPVNNSELGHNRFLADSLKDKDKEAFQLHL